MPRGPRLDTDGALHHVMVRGLEGRAIFVSNTDRKDLVARLSEIIPKTTARLYAWSFLTNHVHFLIRTGSIPLSRVMRKILTGYAVSFNRRHKRSGHLFQNRYKSILVEEEPYLLELVRYIHLNPLRAGVVQNICELENYAWCGHSVLLGNIDHRWQECRFILAQLGKNVKKARKVYRKFVEEGISQGNRPELMGGGLIRSIGGWKRVNELRRGRERWAHDERVLGSSEFVTSVLKEIDQPKEEISVGEKAGPEVLPQLTRKIALGLGLTIAELIGGSRRRNVVTARNIVSYVAVRRNGMSLSQVAKALNISKQSVLRGLERGGEELQRRRLKVEDFAK